LVNGSPTLLMLQYDSQQQRMGSLDMALAVGFEVFGDRGICERMGGRFVCEE